MRWRGSATPKPSNTLITLCRQLAKTRSSQPQRLIAFEGLGDALNGSSLFNEAVKTYMRLCDVAVGRREVEGASEKLWWHLGI